MLVRCASYGGTVAPEDKERFDRHVQQVHLPMVADSQEDMDVCMASEDRKRTREKSAADFATFKGLFRGEVHHVNYAVIDIPLPG